MIAALTGNAADPTGNIQLGSFGSSPATVLSGNFGGHAISLSSLTSADWTFALAEQYITAAATTLGLSFDSFDPAPMTGAVTAFLNFPLAPNNTTAAQRVSDPNISYVNHEGSFIKIGLAGLFDAYSYLNPIALALTGQNLEPNKPAGTYQASEVVKVNWNGADHYLYSFSAIQTPYTTGDFFSGNYEVTLPAHAVPTPATLLLLGVGLAALRMTRRSKV